MCVEIHIDLYDSLCHHRFGYFHEARNVCSFHIVDILAFFSVFDTLLMDRAHDLVQPAIDFGRRDNAFGSSAASAQKTSSSQRPLYPSEPRFADEDYIPDFLKRQ